MSKSKKRRKKRFHRQTTPGTAPGVIAPHPDATPSVISATIFSADKAHRIAVKHHENLVKLEDEGKVLWIDIRGLGDAQTLHHLGSQFNLHPLALEDVVNVHQQVKVEDYGDHLFVVARAVSVGSGNETPQVSLFLGRNFVITFQEDGEDSFDSLRKRLEDSKSHVRNRGADFLAYSMLDTIIDGYFPVLENYGEQLDELEDLITDNPTHGVIHKVHAIRNDLRTLRRIVWQHREAINVLLRDTTDLINTETRTFLRDCHDHTLQLVDLLEIYRETCSDIRDVYLSTVSNRMNEIMIVLTIMASIFIPLSFIAGLYGMNFNTGVSRWNMPELNWFYGYPFALALMAAVAIGMLQYFRSCGWIGRRQ